MIRHHNVPLSLFMRTSTNEFNIHIWLLLFRYDSVTLWCYICCVWILEYTFSTFYYILIWLMRITLYTTSPHQKPKNRLASIIRNSFIHKNWNRRYKYLVLGREGPYFIKEHSDSKSKYTEKDIIMMLEFLVDNIFLVFAGKDRHSHGHKLCLSPSRHISVLVRSRIHTVLALDR